LGKRVPQVDQYDTQIDKYDFPPPRTAEQIAADKEKQVEYLTDYDSDPPAPTQAAEAGSTDYESDSTNPRQTKETQSTDEELNKETSFDASVIRNSPIGTQPKLTPAILTTMSTTTTQPTITVQAATTATTSGTTTGGTTTTATTATTGTSTLTPTQRITSVINKALRRNPGSGPGGPGSPGGPEGPGGPGGPGGPAAPAINPLAVVPQAADVRLMGSLPAVFLGNRAEAEHFINGIQAYI